MKKTAILSILLSLCMVVTLLSGVSAFAATEAGTVADIDGYVCPAADGYQNYHFTAEEAGVVTITTDGPSSVENWTSGEDYMQFFEEGGTATISVAEGDVIRVQTQYTSQPVTLAATFTPAGAEGGEEEEIDTTVLEGTYEAGYAGLMPDMWILTFNNGILSIKDNNNGKYTGSYDYSVDADGMIAISGGDGTLGVIGTPGNYIFFCGGCPGGVAMVKTANASAGEGGDEPAIDTSVLNGVYEAQFYGEPMYKLTFNNGTLTIASLGSVANDVSGTYSYTVVEGLPVADCGLFSKDAGGNLTFQPNGFMQPMTLVKTGELSGGDVGGGDEPVDPPADPDEGNLVVGENSVEVSQENATFGQEFVFVATEAGNYVLTATDSNAYISVDGGYNYIESGETADFTLEAGESITIMVGCFSESADTIEFTIEVKEEGDEPTPEGPIVVYGPGHLNESYSEGYLGAGESQEYMLYYPANGYLVVDAYYAYVTINGEQHFCMYGGTFQLTEEDAVNVDEDGFGYVSIIVKNTYASDYEIYFEYPEGSGENPEELDSLHKVEHTLTAENYYYTWTADFTGELTIWLNQGVDGAKVDITIHDEARENYASLWDWETNSAKENLTISVVEGTVYTIEVIEYGDDDGNTIGGDIIFSNREALVADGSSNDPFDLEEGEMELVMEAGKSEEGLYYIYTPSGNGILTITIQDWDGTALYISGGGMVKQDNGYTFIAEVTEGEQIKLNFWLLSDGACDMDLTVEFTDESEIEYELGTEQNPEEVDSIDGLVFTVNNADYYYKWTATESGTLTITLNTTWGYGYNLLVNGESLFGNGETMEIEVAVGDEIVLVNSVYASADSNGSITLSAEFGDGSDVPSAGDYTFLVFALMAMSMTALVVLVSKKRAF